MPIQGESFGISIRPTVRTLLAGNRTPLEKTGQNGLFLEVFGTFDTLPDTVFNPNFKRR